MLFALCALLLNNFIRSCQDIRWNREADLLCGFEIDDKFEFCRLLDWEFGGLGTFEDLIDIDGGAPVQVGQVYTVGHEPSN
jgi:hypothetical protein